MIALINTIFNPVLSWLTKLLSYLKLASTPKAYVLNFGNLFRPLNMISPAWSLFLSNVFVMVGVYLIIHIVMSGSGLYQKFKNSVQWW